MANEQKNTERKCKHANDYGGGLADRKLYTCELDGRCDMQQPYGQGMPFCRIPLNQEAWYDEAGKPRFNIWHVSGNLGELLTMCSTSKCKKIKIGETWLARNEGESLYDKTLARYSHGLKLSHGLCQKCFEDEMAEITKEERK